ncbi:MAG: hypothetical protein A3B30_04345 [Candidatus Komeilibacteria bacterium RIFCSPLOWO2_01_FULL_52_15]|uniref:dTDP-4-dehydrorhamnose reductase n=2 Tax=Candidatus Komeiliibacteriota TaxID=1817908 RepID=A0A1G2BPT0_9BACT|nr:MAG: hypothetical protein A2677_04105 [Candidatus Komeilibacteria bacterium RIFCSPHIGHO2_01_FULL_52_14]OGY91113.1 MAG: hypothetical protein A3B30_04345 [Candidatus Komeilibacteria bacterium RIFCSPLOWO2_01_FULL_52_15]
MARVLILGVTGALGSFTYDYFRHHTRHEVRGTVRPSSRDVAAKFFQDDPLLSFEAGKADVRSLLQGDTPDYIINCIGIINKPAFTQDDVQKVASSLRVNSVFPYSLTEACANRGTKIVQIATDCVYSGSRGEYTENDVHDALDIYGQTKSLGEVHEERFLNIRCSFVGPEIHHELSLLEWFLSQPDGANVSGYMHHRWNGVTSLQYAQLCSQIIDKGDDFFRRIVRTSYVHHYIPNGSVTKRELLESMATSFKKKCTVVPAETGPAIDRTLATVHHDLLKTAQVGAYPMQRAIGDLYDYLRNEKLYQRRFS